MIRVAIFFLVISILFAACQDSESNDQILHQPPYDKLTDSIKLAPSKADLYYRRGSLFYSNTLPVYAERDMREAWRLDPREEYALSLTTILRDKSADSAILFLQQALKRLPSSIALKIGLARGYEQKVELDKSLAICNEIIAQYPNQLDALILKSDLLKEQDKTQEALATLEQAYGYAPFDKDLAYNYAYDLANAKSAKALSLCDSLIRNDSTETVAKAYYVKATFYKNTGLFKQALPNYDSSIRHDYNFMDAYLDKGELLYDLKQYNAAMQTFQLALRVSPTTADFYYWKGKTEEAMHNTADAKLDYERAYGLDKSMTEAKAAADKIR